MVNQNKARGAALVAGMVLAAGGVQAAGGHHDVDDAEILGRGDCEQENWVMGGRAFRLLHTGVGCRVGPVELDGAVERVREDDDRFTAWNVEAKWAREIAEGFSVGFDVQPTWRAQPRLRYDRTIAYAIATWKPWDSLALHANFGRDFVRGDRDQPRWGAAAEWWARKTLSFVAERYLDEGTHFARAGVRWAAGRTWTIDFSHARRIAGPNPSHWAIGLSFDLDDD